MKAVSDLRRILISSGLSASEAKILTRLLTTPMDRPRTELINYFRRFSEIADMSSESQEVGLASLLERQLIIRDQKLDGDEYLHISSCQQISSLLGVDVEELELRIAEAQRALSWQASIMDHSGSSIPLTSWLEMLMEASSSIDLCIFASAYEVVTPIVMRAAQSGVRVRVLVGDPNLVAQVRGGRERGPASKALATWLSLRKSSGPGATLIAVRSIKRREDLAITGSSLIDKKILRFTIFNPETERGSEGKLLAVVSEQRESSLNLIRIYQTAFDKAWERANRFGRDAISRRTTMSVATLGLVSLPLANQPKFWTFLPGPIEAALVENSNLLNELIGAAIVLLVIYIGRPALGVVKEYVAALTKRINDV